MYEVRVEKSFSAAHFLSSYEGKCESLHGHNYRVLSYLRGDTLDSTGLLVDFALVKRALAKVLEALDHTNLNELHDDRGESVFYNNPSAERIAKYIFNSLSTLLAPALPKGVALYAIDVYETATSRARYTLD